MTFENERDRLLEKLAKIPDLEALLKSSTIGEHLEHFPIILVHILS